MNLRVILPWGYNLGEGGVIRDSLLYTPGYKPGLPKVTLGVALGLAVLYPGIVWSEGILWAVTPGTRLLVIIKCTTG